MHPKPGWILGATFSLLLLVPAGIASAGPTEGPVRDPDPVPQIEHRLVTKAGERKLLDKPRHGRDAIKQLGSNLDDAARVNKMSVTKLERILTTDSTAWLARNGRMYYAEQAEGGRTYQAAADLTAVPFPLSDTFLLHSKLGSSHTVYLDFNGYTLPAGSLWDTDGGMTPGTFNAFSIDGDFGTFTDAEKTYVQHVWQITAEKYAAYDVDVTTQDPGAAAYNRSSAGDTTYGDHVVLTDDPDARPPACPMAGCGGVAWLDTFDEIGETGEFLDYLEPTWVYTTTFDTQYPAPDTANAAAHEVGHTLGLLHDGLGNGNGSPGNDAYYAGHANWFPLMGSGINAVGQFSKGEYTNASQTQDDLAVIQTDGGLPRRSDDWGDVATPTGLGQQVTYTVDGVIEDRTDQDAFTISRTCAGDIITTATGIGEGQALDIQLTILGSGGGTLATDDPVSGQDTSVVPRTPTGLNASASVSSAAAGTYRVVVDGVGKDTASTGYTDYGSIGRYHLTITGCSGSGGPVVSAPTAPRIGRASSGTAGRPINARARWRPPAVLNGSTVTGYRVLAFKLNSRNQVVRRIVSTKRSAAARSYLMRLPAGRYKFKVVAYSTGGTSPRSSYSRIVTAR